MVPYKPAGGRPPFHDTVYVVVTGMPGLSVLIVVPLAEELFPDPETVHTIEETQAKYVAVRQMVRDAEVQVPESIMSAEGLVITVLAVLAVCISDERNRNSVQPRATQAELEGRASTDDRALQLDTSVDKAQGECPVEIIQVAVAGGDVYHRRHAAAVTGRETALVEIQSVHDVGIERREKAYQVTGVIYGRAVQEEKVISACAAVDEQAGHQFGTGSHARQQLEGLDEVGGAEHGKALVQILPAQPRQAGLGPHRRLHAVCGHPRRRQSVAQFRLPAYPLRKC